MIGTILLAVPIAYVITGIIFWRLGLKAMGGKEEYKAYIRETLKTGESFYYAIFFAFILSWPLFLRRNGGEK